MSGDHPIPGDPAEVVWNGDGSYTPTCEPCGYVGKDRPVHADASAAVRRHASSARHRAALREDAEPEWWKVPDDEDVMDGADLMGLLGDELEALIHQNELDVYVYQRLLEYSDLTDRERETNERWLKYHQARVRQLKHVHARVMTRKLPAAGETG
jgi:hypothetical protein